MAEKPWEKYQGARQTAEKPWEKHQKTPAKDNILSAPLRALDEIASQPVAFDPVAAANGRATMAPPFDIEAVREAGREAGAPGWALGDHVWEPERVRSLWTGEEIEPTPEVRAALRTAGISLTPDTWGRTLEEARADREFADTKASDASGRLATVVRDLPFGFGDEVVGGITGALNYAGTLGDEGSFGRGYDAGTNFIREPAHDYAERNPWSALGLSALSSIAGGGVAAKAARHYAPELSARVGSMIAPAGGALKGNVARGLGLGVGAGAVGGFASGDTPEERRQYAGIGAALGGFFGGGTPAVSGIYRSIRGLRAAPDAPGLAPLVDEVMQPNQAVVAEINAARRGGQITDEMQAAGVTASDTAEQAAVKMQTAREVAAMGEAGQYPRLPDDVRDDRLTAAYLARQMEREGLTTDQLRGRLEATREGGRPVTLADVGGENFRGALDTAVNQPGRARSLAAEFFGRRQTGVDGRLSEARRVGKSQADRIADDLSLTGRRGQYFEDVDALLEKRAQDAAPLYDEAYAAHGGAFTSPAIDRLLKTPAGRSAFDKALRIAENEVVGADPTNPAFQRQFARAVDYLSNGFVENRPIPWRALDLVKRGLDDVVESHRDPVTRKISTNEGRAASSVLHAFRSEMRRQNPSYGAALDAYSGPTHTMGVMEDGRSIFSPKTQPEQVAKQMRGLPAGDRDAYIAGIEQALKEKLDNIDVRHDASKRVLGGRDQAKLYAAVGKEKGDEIVRRLRTEAAMYETQGVMGGSQTARRLAQQDDLDANTAEAVMFDMLTTPGATKATSLVRRGLEALRNYGSGVHNEQVRENLTKMLLAAHPKDQERVLAIIEREIANRTAQQAARSTSAAATGLGSGLGAGSGIGSVD